MTHSFASVGPLIIKQDTEAPKQEDKPELILHLSLPKTATGFLKEKVYPYISNTHVVSSSGLLTTKIIKVLDTPNQSQEAQIQSLFKKVIKAEKTNILVFPELLAKKQQDLDVMLDRLKVLTKDYRVKVVMGIRNQAHLLLSHYYWLKSQKKNPFSLPEFFNNSFFAKDGLDYAKIHQAVSRVFLKDNVHLYMQERLYEDPIYEVIDLINFINPSQTLDDCQKIEQSLFDKINSQKKVKGYSFFLKKHLENNTKLCDELLAHYKQSNLDLEKQARVPLRFYGYTAESISDDIPCMPQLKNKSWKSSVGPYFNQLCDQIYVINLDRDLDRLKSFQAHTQDIGGLKYQRLAAVNGGALANSMTKNVGAHHILTKKGAVGCTLSHIQIYQDALKKGYQKILILEDDARFKPYADKVVKNAMKDLPEDWEALFLGFFHVKPPRKSLSPHLDQVKKRLTTHGYIISRRGLLKLYAGLESIALREKKFRGVDVFIRDCESAGELNSYSVRPKAIYCTTNISSIRNTEQDYGKRCEQDLALNVNAFTCDNYIKGCAK